MPLPSLGDDVAFVRTPQAVRRRPFATVLMHLLSATQVRFNGPLHEVVGLRREVASYTDALEAW